MAQESYSYPKDHAFWNPLFIIFFLILTLLAFGILFASPHAKTQIYALDGIDLLIISLAAFRLLRLVTYDKILQFFRDFFLVRGVDGALERPESGFNRAVVELYECVWCTGMWAALAALFLYCISPFGFFAALVLALSALATVFQNLSRLIAKFAEK